MTIFCVLLRMIRMSMMLSSSSGRGRLCIIRDSAKDCELCRIISTAETSIHLILLLIRWAVEISVEDAATEAADIIS